MLELLDTKTYGLVWENKPEDVEEKLKEKLPVLTEVTDKRILSEDKNAPNHILIEGDNLEALTALAYTYEGKIDLIYIDPPYNTGNKDFKYNDNYVDAEDGYRHSKWLSFMAKRLRIARQLLSDKGVIFISIDDNEQAQLKLLCDEIFNNNFLQQIIIESNPRGSQSSKYFANTHEYLFCFSKSKNPLIVFGFNMTEDNISEYSLEDEKGKYRLLGLRQRGGAWRREDRPLLFFPIYINPDTGDVSLIKDNLHTIEVIPSRPTGEESRWTWSKEKIERENNFIVGCIVNKGTEKEKWDVFRKNYILNDNGEIKKSKVKSIWTEKEINYQNGGTELKEILGKELFSYPKPLFFIHKVLSCSTAQNAIILDFFAGSGTTLHATMQLNNEDGGHRQCILVTNNENNICEEVTYERNRRVIQGYTNAKGEKVTGLTHNNLRYYKTKFVGRERTPKNMRELMSLSTDMLCIKENLYNEKENFAGRNTINNVFRYFDNGTQRMLVIYREEAVEEMAKLIAQTKYDNKIKVYVFSPSEDPWEDTFANVADKVELCALPQAIYNTYRRILPKRKDVIVDAEKSEEENEDSVNNNYGLFNFDEEDKA